MEDLSDFFKKGFQRVHQKDYKQKTIKDKREDYSNIRRKTRDTLIFQKRNIDLNILTPICTPEMEKKDNNILNSLQLAQSLSDTFSKENNKKTIVAPNTKRLEMLKKWKIEKEKKKMEERKKAKPLFKIYHVPLNVGLPNLENVNKEIKGKPIKKTETFKSTFAPDNHKFQPPKNIVPIPIHRPNERLQKFELRKNISIKTGTQDSTNKLNQTRLQGNLNQNKTETHINKSTNFKNNAVAKKKQTPQQINKSEPVKRLNSAKQKTLKTPVAMRKTPNAKKQPRKEVMWDVVQVIDSDNEILTQDIKTKKTPQKKYSKTPIKKRVALISDSYNNTFDDDSITAGTSKVNASLSFGSLSSPRRISTKQQANKSKKAIKFSEQQSFLDSSGMKAPPQSSSLSSRNRKTPTKNEPKRKLTTKKRASTNKTTSSIQGGSSETTEQNVTQDVKKMKRSISVEELVVSPKKTPSKSTQSRRKSSVCRTPQPSRRQESSDTEDDLIIHSRKLAAASLDNVTDHEKKSSSDDTDVNNFIVNKKLEEKIVLYSDDEVTLKTPVKKLKSKNLRKSVLKSAERDANRQFTSTPNPTKRNNDHAVYISPFVTISRGKDSARKEYKLRLSTGGTIPDTPEFDRGLSKNTSPGAGAAYFSKKLQEEKDRIEALCLEWMIFKEEIPEEVEDMVDAAIGQSNLLISKKFQQFSNLIKLCENGNSQENPVTCTDLHGYWDTMYMQVEDIIKRFNNLQVLKDNNWKEILIPEKKPVAKRRRGRPKKIQAQSKIKDMVKKARLLKNNPELLTEASEPTIKPFEIVSLPLLSEKPSSTKKRKSLLDAKFGNKENRKLSSSPGIAMLRLSQAIKCGDGLTPSKSILKTDSNRSEKKIIKSVLFKDLEQDKENSYENLMVFSPVKPRRSQRISRIT